MKSPELITSHYLAFTSGTSCFAVPADCVQEILCLHTVTPLPFVPECIDGLVNIEGKIAVQVNFSHLHGQAHHKGKELILIDTGRSLCALKVDEVLGRVSLPSGKILPFITDEYTTFHAEIDNIEADFFIGTYTKNHITTLIVDHQRIGQLVQAGAAKNTGEGILGKIDNSDDREEDMSIACLVTLSGEDRYAFELNGIMEIVEAGACTPIPGAPDYLEGFHLVRGHALPVINLLAMIDQPQPATKNNWIIIVERDNFRYGLLVNAIEGIVNFPLESYEPIVDTESNLSGLFIYQEKTTVLLSPKRIVHDEILDILSQHATFQPKDLVSTVEETERYLRVSICEKTYAIPLENVKRVAQFFPMEKISDNNGHIQGAIDLDGSIIPVLALEKALALKRQTAEGEYVIVSKNQHEWAICVDLAQGIVDVPVSNIKHMQAGNSHYINGIAHIDENLVPLLDFSILQNQKESTTEHQQ